MRKKGGFRPFVSTAFLVFLGLLQGLVGAAWAQQNVPSTDDRGDAEKIAPVDAAFPPALAAAAPPGLVEVDSQDTEGEPAAPPTPPCEASGPGIELEDGYRIDLCFVPPAGEPRAASDWGLPPRTSALFHFFDRDNAEVLVKVLDGCAINGHSWVFAAPVTNLAFHLVVTAPDGRTWRHVNAAGQTAAPRGDTAAFSCP